MLPAPPAWPPHGGGDDRDDRTTRTRRQAGRLAAGARATLPRDRRTGRAHLGRCAHAAPDYHGPALRPASDHAADLWPGRGPLPRGGFARRGADAPGLVPESPRPARGAGPGDGRPLQGSRPPEHRGGEAGAVGRIVHTTPIGAADIAVIGPAMAGHHPATPG